MKKRKSKNRASVDSFSMVSVQTVLCSGRTVLESTETSRETSQAKRGSYPPIASDLVEEASRNLTLSKFEGRKTLDISSDGLLLC